MKRQSIFTVSHIHTWRLPSTTTVWSADCSAAPLGHLGGGMLQWSWWGRGQCWFDTFPTFNPACPKEHKLADFSICPIKNVWLVYECGCIVISFNDIYTVYYFCYWSIYYSYYSSTVFHLFRLWYPRRLSHESHLPALPRGFLSIPRPDGIIPPLSSGSVLGSSPDWPSLVNLQQKAPRRNPDSLNQPLDVKEQWFYSELPQYVWTAHPIFLSHQLISATYSCDPVLSVINQCSWTYEGLELWSTGEFKSFFTTTVRYNARITTDAAPIRRSICPSLVNNTLRHWNSFPWGSSSP